MSQQSTTSAPAAGARPDPLLTILDQMMSLTNQYGRSDLAEGLGVIRTRILDPSVRVLVVGEYKKGKSSLVNGLIGVEVAPVDDDIATSVPTVLRYGEVARAILTREPPEPGGSPSTEEIAITDLASFVSELGNPGNIKRARVVEAWIPRKLLQGGLVLVDTPGVGGLGSAHTASTLSALPSADAVLFVSDASQELTAAEIEFVKVAQRSCPNLLGVLTKTDLYPSWQRILELNVDHLRRAGVSAPLIPVSSLLRHEAVTGESAEVNAESGYPALVTYLRSDVIGRAKDLAKRSVLDASVRAVDQLAQPLVTERQVLSDPDRSAEVARQLQDAKARADDLRGRSAKWQQTLGDGFADLQGDLDHDFRQRMRDVTQVAEAALDDLDPAESWEEFRTWLNERVTYEVTQNFSIIAERAHALAEVVADHFESGAEGLELRIEAPAATMGRLSAPDVALKRAKVASLGFTAVRQAYSNVSMFSMFGSMAHIAIGMTNPATLTIGLLTGGKAVRDARQQQLNGRRQQAKAAVRKFVDEVSFQVGKDFRDTTRHLQRELRDTFARRADEIQRSTTENLAAATRATQQDKAESQARLQRIEADLKRLGGVRQKLVAFAAQAGSPV